ncbi:uncharacterized protein LOC118744836 isoform X1 [Rhagoletis pomonella]|uniref:uncharacterized protein LOC118744836 isoform X1 n=1 Tax=Rhagoletis pomonella TaxID=28610 RepID=UPI00177D5582|nr:uncharacterized protein LOC118744836 isoform X1 [Rhagoletis pomonella]
MKVHIALILLLSAVAVSARSFGGYKCKEYPIESRDSFTPLPLRTVRVCEVIQNGAPPTRFQMASEAEDLVKPLLPSNTLYGTGAIWPRQVFQHTPISWPLQSHSYNNVKEQFIPTHMRSISPSTHSFQTFNQIGLNSNNPWSNNNELNPRNMMDVDRSLQQQLNSLVENVSEVKDSITHLVPYLKNILDILVLQSTQVKSEENLNVNLKLDPSLEGLLRQFLQLTESSTEMNEEQIGNKILAGIDDEKVTTEDSSEEKTTEVPNIFLASSTEQDTREDSEEAHIVAGKTSLESVDSWIRRRFGPSVKPGSGEEEIDKTSEEENSAEKSDESFETWFNYVYRSFLKEKDYNLKASSHNAHEGGENVQNQSRENSKEDSEENGYEDAVSKSSKNSKEIGEYPVNNDNNLNYETIFIPKAAQDDKKSEHLENGDRYDYTAESNKIVNYVKPDIKASNCIQMALSIATFDDRELFNKYNKCVKDLLHRNNVNQVSERKFEDHLGSTGSKESGEAEKTTSNSNESKDSREIESTTRDSNESKESGEIESTTPNSNELEDSDEYYV